MSKRQMALAAGAVFVADFAAAVVIVGSLWFERQWGIGRGAALTVMFVIAVSYGAAAWGIGRRLMRTVAHGQSGVVVHDSLLPRAAHK